jgi:hypothetical protein
MSADPFLDAEAGVESSQPREFYEIVQSAAVTYRIASGSRDIVYNGQTFTAYPSARTEMPVDIITQPVSLTLALPLSHPLVQRYVSLGSPPRQISITIYRRQLGVGDEVMFLGLVTSMGIDSHIAKFMLESRFARMMSRRLPVLTASRTCPHILYDANCRVNRATYTIATTVAFINGRTIDVASMAGKDDQWARDGELVHVKTGERIPVVNQIGTRLTLQSPIPDILDGDAVTVSAGCAHDVITCRLKFQNQVNFGGLPQLPNNNPFAQNGLGVVEQS